MTTADIDNLKREENQYVSIQTDKYMNNMAIVVDLYLTIHYHKFSQVN